MARLESLLVVVGAAAIAVGLTRKPKPDHGPKCGPADGPRRVVALGDSITVGCQYLKSLKSTLPPGSQVRCYAYGGYGAEDIAKKGLAKAIAWRPTDVVVLAGVNDMSSDRPPARIVKAIRKMLSAAAAAGARPIAIGILPWASYRRSNARRQAGTAEINRALASTPGVCYVDPVRLSDGAGGLRREFWGGRRGTDPLHPNKNGLNLLGREIKRQAF